MRIGGEPMFGRGGDSLGEGFEVLAVEVDVAGVFCDESAGFADVGKGGEVGSRCARKNRDG